MIFIIIDDHIDNFNPAMQSLTRTDKKIIFIKNIQNIIFQLFRKTMPFLNKKHGNLASAINKHTILCFILNNR